MKSIILIGAGALTRDLVEAFGASAFAAIYVDPAYAAAGIGGLPLVTSWEAARRLGGHYMLGVSDIAHRARAAAAAEAAGVAAAPAMVTRTAIVAADATLAPGTAIGHMAMVGPSARLAGNTLVTGRDPTTVLHVILTGGFAPHIPGKPAVKPMPAFAQLDDGMIADVASYIRNAWGNRASPVSATDVHLLRRSIAASPTN